jgi:soluble lytic murein transglycosylase-like protein
MVTIPQYVAGNLLNPASAPRVSADTSGADAMARAGNALMGLGASIDAERERQGLKAQADLEQKEDLDAKLWASRARADAALWDARTRTELARTASADNPDWSQTYSDSWKAYEKQILGTAPNERARQYWQLWAPGFNAGAVQGEGGVIANVEAAKAAKRQTDFNATLDKHILTVVQDPAEINRVIGRIEDDVDALAPFLAPGQELELKTAAIAAAKKAAREGFFRRDPLTFKQVIEGAGSVPTQTNDARTIMGRLIPAESSGNPNAVSPKGAAGLAQVMPSTAPEIARELGDQNFPFNNPEQIREYLKDPEVSVRYGTHYLQKQLDRYGGETKAALIAYNAGPKRADQWLQSGRNDAVLPAETRDYVAKIMGGGAAAPALDLGPDTQLDAGTFRSKHYTWQDLRNDRWSTSTVSSRAVTALDWVTDQFGSKLKITSGYRAPNHPAESAKARPGQHTHGQAIDIDVSGMSDADKSRLVALFVQAGARGLGHYPPGSGGAGTIHVDFRAGRGKQPDGLALWYGSQPYANGEAWFKAGIDQGRQAGPAMGAGGTGAVPPGIASDPLFQGATPEEVWGYVDKANQVVDEQRKAMAAAETARLAALKDSFSLQIATGQPLSQNDILASDLGDGDKASLINTLNERTAKTQDMSAFLEGIQSGAKISNPFDTKTQGMVDDAFDSIVGGNRDAAQPFAEDIASKTGIAPKGYLGELRAGLLSSNPQTVLGALQQAQRLRSTSPTALARDGGKAVEDAAIDFKYMTEDLGYTPAEAAAKFIAMNDPEKRKPVTMQQIDKAVEAVTIDTVTDAFDPSVWATEPAGGFSPQQQTAVLGDFRELFRREYIESQDETSAMARATEKFRRLYNATSVTGTPTLMKYPPESYYPPAGEMGHVYLQDQLLAYAREATGNADLTGDQVFIASTTETAAQIRAGKAPSYVVGTIKEDANGFPVFDILTPQGMQFAFDPAAGIADAEAKLRAERQQRFDIEREQELMKRGQVSIGDPVLDDLNRQRDERARQPAPVEPPAPDPAPMKAPEMPAQPTWQDRAAQAVQNGQSPPTPTIGDVFNNYFGGN